MRNKVFEGGLTCSLYKTRLFTFVVRWDVDAGKHYVNVYMGDVQIAFAQGDLGLRRAAVRLAANQIRKVLMWPMRKPL